MKNPQKMSRFESKPIIASVVGITGTVLAAVVGNTAVATLWLGTLLSVVIGLLLHRRRLVDGSSIGLLETPFYLSHDAEIFERYQQLSQQ